MIFRDLDLEMGVSVEHSPLRSSPLRCVSLLSEEVAEEEEVDGI